jgi:hypothetical protein
VFSVDVSGGVRLGFSTFGMARGQLRERRGREDGQIAVMVDFGGFSVVSGVSCAEIGSAGGCITAYAGSVCQVIVVGAGAIVVADESLFLGIAALYG